MKCTILRTYTLLILLFTVASICLVFFFNDTPTTEIYTLSLHDALPTSHAHRRHPGRSRRHCRGCDERLLDRRGRSEEHTSELQSHSDLVCRLLLEKKKNKEHGKQGEEDDSKRDAPRADAVIIEERCQHK